MDYRTFPGTVPAEKTTPDLLRTASFQHAQKTLANNYDHSRDRPDLTRWSLLVSATKGEKREKKVVEIQKAAGMLGIENDVHGIDHGFVLVRMRSLK